MEAGYWGNGLEMQMRSDGHTKGEEGVHGRQWKMDSTVARWTLEELGWLVGESIRSTGS